MVLAVVGTCLLCESMGAGIHVAEWQRDGGGAGTEGPQGQSGERGTK